MENTDEEDFLYLVENAYTDLRDNRPKLGLNELDVAEYLDGEEEIAAEAMIHITEEYGAAGDPSVRSALKDIAESFYEEGDPDAVESINVSLEILEGFENSGRNGRGIAGAAFYTSELLRGNRRTQREIAAKSGVQPSTIRSAYTDILEQKAENFDLAEVGDKLDEL